MGSVCRLNKKWQCRKDCSRHGDQLGAEEGSCRAATLDHTDDCAADSDEVVCVKPWGAVSRWTAV